MPPIVYIGPPKTGSSSFHALMTHIGLPSFHVGGPGLMNAMAHGEPSLGSAYQADEISCAETGRTVHGPLPTSRIVQMIGSAAIDCMFSSSGYTAFADDPWPLLYRRINQLVPDARFVLWAREPRAWARSFVQFFKGSDIRWLRLAYGVCNMTAAYEPFLSELMREHVAQVRAYFDQHDRSRLMVIDDLNALGVPHQLCAFALGNASHPMCNRVAAIPHILPPSADLGFNNKYNVPLGKPIEIPAWRQCVADHQGAGSESDSHRAKHHLHARRLSLPLHTSAANVTFNMSGGCPRSHAHAGLTVLATSEGGSPTARCRLASTADGWHWTSVDGPVWEHLPIGTDLSNCAAGVAPDGTMVVGVRHHDGAEDDDGAGSSTAAIKAARIDERVGSLGAAGAWHADIARGMRPRSWAVEASTFRIQVVRRNHTARGDTAAWETPITVYATTNRSHAAWEPTFFLSRDRSRLRVAYSLERPADWLPPACLSQTALSGADLSPPALAPSAAACQGRCAAAARCAAWSWKRDGSCSLKSVVHGAVAEPAAESGAKLCGAGTGSPVLATAGVADGRVPRVDGRLPHLQTAHELLRHGDGDEMGRRREASRTQPEKRVEGREDGPSAPLEQEKGPSSALEQDVVVQESADGGLSWGPVRVVSRTARSRDGMPSVLRQPDGCLTIVHEGFGGASWGHFTVRALRSCDDGDSWTHQAVSPTGGGDAPTAHAPTIALLPDGRALVASYNDAQEAQTQTSLRPLNGTQDPGWSSPHTVPEVPSPAAWPNVFTDVLHGHVWIAYGHSGSTHVAGPIATG